MWFMCLLLLAQNCLAYEFTVLKSADLASVLPFIAEQRMSCFSGYPYLYDGTFEYEMSYLSWFANLLQSAAVVVYYEQKPVGFLTGVAAVSFGEHFTDSQQAFESQGLDFASYYYFSECIVVPGHRGHNLSEQMFALLEEYALRNGFTKFCFVTEEHDYHLLKPASYISLGKHWERLGYTKSNIEIRQRWKTFQADGTSTDSDHTLTYWLKKGIIS